MKIIRETAVIVGKSILVTLAVALGFSLGSNLGLPSLLQPLCLIPAAYLFYRLSEGTYPAWWKPISFLAFMSGILFLLEVSFPTLPPGIRGAVVVVLMQPLISIAKRIEQRSGKASDLSAGIAH
jgi:hypothetical protein